jgi:hypothetical protein
MRPAPRDLCAEPVELWTPERELPVRMEQLLRGIRLEGASVCTATGASTSSKVFCFVAVAAASERCRCNGHRAVHLCALSSSPMR